MSCLIIKNDGIGDLILASGLIRSVGRLFDGNVDLLTCSNNREIAEGIDSLRNRFYCSRDSIRINTSITKTGVNPFRRREKVQYIPHVQEEDSLMLEELSEHEYDIVICMRRFIRQSTLVIMQRVHGQEKFCAWQYPMHTSYESAQLATHGWVHFAGNEKILSELDYNRAFLESILNTKVDSRPRLSFCHKQNSPVSSGKIALGLGGGSNNWPYGHWIELAMRLASTGWELQLLGGKDVADLGAHIALKVPAVNNLIGHLDWGETAACLAGCEGFIGNDTGLSHFASLILDKCLVVLGGGTFRRFFPWPGAGNQYLLYHGLDCFDCTWECKFHDRFCVSLIQPRDVEEYFGAVIRGETSSECDLNAHIAEYPLAWRQEENSGLVSVRPIRSSVD